MATSYYDAEDFFTINAEQFPLTISVQLGDGQGGGYLIFNGTDLVGINTEATIDTIEAISEWITVTATIKDKLEETNWTSITITLKANNKRKLQTFGPYKREVEKHLDTVGYTVKLKMLAS